jgi:hypothetical protein
VSKRKSNQMSSKCKENNDMEGSEEEKNCFLCDALE